MTCCQWPRHVLVLVLTVAPLWAQTPAISLPYTSLNVPGSSNTMPTGINNTGTITGTFTASDGTFKGFLYSNNTFSYFSVPGQTFTFTGGINDSGVAVGYYYATTTGRVGYSYDGTAFADIRYRQFPITEAFGINNAGLIVGETAPDTADYMGMTYDGKQFQTFRFPGMNINSTVATAVDSFGNIFGNVDVNGFQQGFSRTPAGKYATISYPGAIFTSVSGVNDNHVVVGTFSDSTTILGCYYMKAGKFNSFIIPGASATLCLSINNAGMIVGYAFNENNGEDHGFIAGPVTDAEFQ